MNKRLVALDVIRVTAILLVITIHSASFFFSGSKLLVFNALGTIGVPLFVILSGYLMLDRDFNGPYLNKFINRNLLPLAIAYILWVIIWYVLSKLFGFLPIGLAPQGMQYTITEALFLNPTNNGLWYLPMLIALYLGTPIVSIFLHRREDADCTDCYSRLIGLLIVAFGVVVPTVSTILRILQSEIQLNPVFCFNIFSADVWGYSVWIFYYLAGYFIKKYHQRRLLPSKGASFSCMSISLFLLIVWHFVKSVHGIQFEVEYSNIFVALASMSLFIFILEIDFSKGNEICKVINKQVEFLSRQSFGIYTVHFWVIALLGPVVQRLFSGFLCYLVFFSTVLFVSIIVCEIISLSKYLSKYLLLTKPKE